MNVQDRVVLVAQWKHLTEQLLPELASKHRWPLRLDHCFKRVCLDFAFGDVWYRHVQKPAEKHMDQAALQRAIQCAEEIMQDGVALLRSRNDESLRYRSKGRHRFLTSPEVSEDSGR